MYFDNILIYFDNPNDHERQVKKMLKNFRVRGLFAKLEKCEFGIDTVEFFGFIINPDGISMDLLRMFTISDWFIFNIIK